MTQVLLALLSAGVLYLATPPNEGWPLALVALVPLLVVSTNAPPRRAAVLGWVSGTTYYLLSCTWWYTVLGRAFDWPPPVALLLYVLLNAWSGLVYAIGAGAISLLRRRFGLHPVLIAPLAFAVAEAMVPHVFKGYIGTTVWRAWPLIQFAELGGPPAVSAVVVLVNAVVAGAVTGLRYRLLPERPVRVGALILLLVVGAGFLRGAQVSAIRSRAPVLRVGLVQVNSGFHAQEEKPSGVALLQAMGRETLIQLANGADLVVWPESIWPALLPRPTAGSAGPSFLQTLLTGFDGQLLFGAINEGPDGARYNSAFLLSSQGRVEATTDKNRLVPFFESAPLAEYLPGWRERLQQLLRRNRPFLHAGREPTLLHSGPLRLGVLFCSEEMQMGYGQEVARRGPNLLVGMVNDYWVGDTPATSQHVALAAFRAVEARRDLIHVTEAGISALVDGSGRVRLLAAPAPNPGEAPPVTAMQGEAAPLDLFTPGPYLIHLFPPACLAVLLLAVYRRRSQAHPPMHAEAVPSDAQSEVKADESFSPNACGGNHRPDPVARADRPSAARRGDDEGLIHRPRLHERL